MKSHLPSGTGSVNDSASWVHRQIRLSFEKPVDVRFYGRRTVHGKSPLVLHLHGGAFVGGSLAQGACVAGLLAGAGAVVMSLDYPLAPLHPFPDAVETAYAALLWAWKSRAKLAGQGAPMLVAGEEAGGNIAAAVALMARDRQDIKLDGQILLSPMLDPCLGTASLRKADAGPVGCIWADGWHGYLPRMADAGHPYAAPGSALRLAGLPATLLVTAQDDPLRDETLAYAQRLRAAGLQALCTVLPGATGWPGSFQQPCSGATAWAPAVQQQFSDFFASPAVSAGQGAGASFF
ncbi:MAG: Alpha/beta hydrolase fold-3 [Polaromonas sp.]|nr:Alpha/beta hydrolase fold-3 [Polaromonas sp.]